MLINMSPCGLTLEEQLSSIMDAHAKAAVSEIKQLFSEGSTTLRLQITQSLKEKEALRTKVKVMRSKLVHLRLQTRFNASRAASRSALARANIRKARIKPLGQVDGYDRGDRSTQRGATSESLPVDAPGSSHMSNHSEELRILSVYGKGEGPDTAMTWGSHDTLISASEVEALSSRSADHSVAKSLEGGERLVHCEELAGQQQTPDTSLIKDEKYIGGGMSAAEDSVYRGDRSTQAISESLPVDAPGSSHMSNHSEELRILSVYGKGEGPDTAMTWGGHDTLFSTSEVEALSSRSADHSVAKSLECGEQLVRREELAGHRGGHNSQPCVLLSKVLPDNTKMAIHTRSHIAEKLYRCYQCVKRFSSGYGLKRHMRTHPGEKPYRCDQCVKRFSTSTDLKRHMRTHPGEKLYRCAQCVKRFSSGYGLKRHMRTHSGEKP